MSFCGGGIFDLTMLVAGIPAMVGWGMILMGTEISLNWLFCSSSKSA